VIFEFFVPVSGRIDTITLNWGGGVRAIEERSLNGYFSNGWIWFYRVEFYP
jgi:hypothetical protein